MERGGRRRPLQLMPEQNGLTMRLFHRRTPADGSCWNERPAHASEPAASQS